MSFQSVLIANRGEIACRIIRTLKDMGQRSIAVFSDADHDAPHVKQADEAVHIGASPAVESYLDIVKIIAAAKQSGAEAVHPGYGFLSENAEFAKACQAAGLVFIGPSPEAIALMGDKASAKRHMIDVGLPVLCGYEGKAQNDKTLIEAAKEVGFPLMVKAAAGGGGRGMRFAEDATELPLSISAARAEAQSAFGSDELILERAIVNPRHVEVQIFGDHHGNIIHLAERDCSVQRRHQKVLEEAPCPILKQALRDQMGAAAVKAAHSVNYVGAGTVEFLLDSEGEFFFLEMNTRLQVEHPVTELVTGLDLVALQIRVAQGEAMGLSQNNISICGHAIEARLYAEDPSDDFLPATGRIKYLSLPDNIRIDCGVESGSEVSPFYDPMIAKLIVSAHDRETARRKLVKALEEMAVFGVATNRQFLIDALNAEQFVTGEATTAFIKETFSDEDLESRPLSDGLAVLSGLTQYLARRNENAASLPKEILGWCSAFPVSHPFQFEEITGHIVSKDQDAFQVTYRDIVYNVRLLHWEEGRATYALDGTRIPLVWFIESPGEIYVQHKAAEYHLIDELSRPAFREEALGAGDIRAPLHGALTDVFAAVGQSVKLGDRLAVIEAMKMQHEVLSDINGTVTDVFAEAGEQVSAKSLLFKIEA